MRDPYSILGVNKSADQQAIKTAWRNAAKALHPDQNPGDPQAVGRFTEMGRAYDLLKDPEKRRRFDEAQARAAMSKGGKEPTFMEKRVERERAEKEARARAEAEARQQAEARARAAAAAAAAGSADPDNSAEDVVAKIFGTRKSDEGPSQSSSYGAGADSADGGRQTRFDEATYGSEARNDGADSRPSPALDLLSYLLKRLTRQIPPPEKAPDLNLDAPVSIEDLLNHISPTLTLPDGKLVSATLPAGAKNGTVIRVEGYGHRLAGMKRGDVVATLRVIDHPWYRVDGHDLRTFHDLDIENAVLGCETMVETLDGPCRITVPEWSGSNRTVKIAGYGLPKGNGERGDLIVEIRVQLWDHPDQKVIDLMRSLREGLFL